MQRRLLVLLLGLLALPTGAATLLLPHSRHQQFLTYGLFNEEQVTFVFRDQNRAWAALGDSFAVIEFGELPGKPQIIVSGAVATSFISKGSLLDFNVETFDARFGAFLEFLLTQEWRLQVGLAHFSGHTSDGIQNPALVAPNLGQDMVEARIIRDFDTHFRIGGTFNFLVTRDPIVKVLRLDQFVDYFPFGAHPGWPADSAPYLSLGFEENGANTYEFTYHAQLGLLFGNHFGPEKQQSMRLVLGYYHGVDPRLKYAVFAHATADFLYAGLMLNM